MIPPDAFRDQPTLTGRRVRLEPLTSAVLDDYLVALRDPEVQRLTGSQGELDTSQIVQWLATRQDHHDRADWAIICNQGDAFIGEAVLNQLDRANESMNYRIFLAGTHLFGRGYGTEATKLVVEYALGIVGLHRVSLGVYDFNPRAKRVYEKCGFAEEGRLRDALHWDGRRHDEILMSVLRTDVSAAQRLDWSTAPP